jgi:hypothetical protein
LAQGIDPTGGSGFLVEDFIQSITTQLDRVQDALRIKAVNRPLTYALKELHLELKVFVDMDATGNVRLRSSGPSDSGASVIRMDFTTITKPMIEENTVSLASTRSTPLANLGMSEDETSKLERLGVTNLAQLDRLQGSTGASTVARLADMPLDRLRRALQAGQPRVTGVTPTRPPVSAPAPRPSPQPAPRPPVAVTPRPPVRPAPPIVVTPRPPIPRRSVIKPGIGIGVGRLTQPFELEAQEDVDVDRGHDHNGNDSDSDNPSAASLIAIPADSRSLTLQGHNLFGDEQMPQVSLNGQALQIEDADHDRMVVRLPEGFSEGALEVSFGDREALAFALVHDAPAAFNPQDPWAPEAR